MSSTVFSQKPIRVYRVRVLPR